MTLKDAHPGETVVVKSVVGEKNNEIKRRIMAFGILPGVKIKVIKFAPFGDPIQISVLGFDLLIRGTEASQILVRYDKN